MPRAKNGGRVAKALKRRFRDQVGQGFSGGVSLIRDAINMWYTFSLAHKLVYSVMVLPVNLLVTQREDGYLCFVVCIHTQQKKF